MNFLEKLKSIFATTNSDQKNYKNNQSNLSQSQVSKKITVEFNEPITKPIVARSETHISETPINEDDAILDFINSYQNGKPIGDCKDDYPRYLYYKYRIEDPIAFHRRLINEGYFVKGDIELSLSKLKVAQLKDILKSNQLSDKGKKNELIQRILKNIDHDSLDLKPIYVLSEKGKSYLDKYNYIFNLKKYDISVDEFEAFKSSCPEHLKTNDIIFRILNQKYNYYNASHSYGLARNQLFAISELLSDENRNVDALFYLIVVLYYDISGLSNNNTIRPIEDVTLAPGIILQIYDLKNFYEESFVEKCFSRYKLPHCYLEINNFKQLLMDIFNGNYNNIDSQIYIKDTTYII